MKRDYPYLISSLPELTTDFSAQKISLSELKNEVKENLNAKDWVFLDSLFFPYDNKNLLNIVLNKNEDEFSDKALFSREELTAGIEKQKGLPDYMIEFLSIVQPKEDAELSKRGAALQKKETENILHTLFYEQMLKSKNAFVRKWYKFDRDLRNIQAAMLARRLKIDTSQYLVGDDVQPFAKNTAPDFGMRDEIEFLTPLLQISEITNVYEREYKTDVLRFNQINEFTTFNYLDIDAVLAIVQKIDIIDRWQQLDKQAGTQRFRELLDSLMSTCDTQKVFAKEE